MEFKDNFKRLRESNGYTQDDIAKEIGISRQSVSKWENGNSEPDIDTIKHLAVFFNCTVDELVGSIDVKIKKNKQDTYKSILLAVILITSVFFIITIVGFILFFSQPAINGHLTATQRGFLEVGPYFNKNDFDALALKLGLSAGIADEGQALLYGSQKLGSNYTLHGNTYYFNAYPIPVYDGLIIGIIFGALTIASVIFIFIFAFKTRKRKS